jgi:hypothetical protein
LGIPRLHCVRVNTFFVIEWYDLLQGCNAVYFSKSSMFRMAICPPSSGSKSKPNKKPEKASGKISFLTLLFDHEDGGDIFLRIVVLCTNYKNLGLRKDLNGPFHASHKLLDRLR